MASLLGQPRLWPGLLKSRLVGISDLDWWISGAEQTLQIYRLTLDLPMARIESSYAKPSLAASVLDPLAKAVKTHKEPRPNLLSIFYMLDHKCTLTEE